MLCPFLILAVSCVSKEPTIEEYNLAQAAYRAAIESEAKRYAPKVFSRASKFFEQGERAFEDRYFDKSTAYFRKSRYYSERAENIARVKMFKQGDMVP